MTSWEILHALKQNILTCCEAVRAGSSVFLNSQKGIASPDSHVGTGPLFKRRGLVSTHSGKKTCIRCLGFQSFTLKLTSPWSCANHDKLCCYCESLIFDQYVTNGHLTESFFYFLSVFLLVKDKTVMQKFAFFFFFFFPSNACSSVGSLWACSRLQAFPGNFPHDSTFSQC